MDDWSLDSHLLIRTIAVPAGGARPVGECHLLGRAAWHFGPAVRGSACGWDRAGAVPPGR